MSSTININSSKGLEVLHNFNISSFKNTKTIFVFNDCQNVTNAFLITSDDKTYGFGGNASGVLGFGHKNSVNKFTNNKNLNGKSLCDFQFSFQHVIARSTDGRVYAWGYNSFGVLGDGRRNDNLYKPKKNKYLKSEFITAISTGFYHTLALTAGGRVYYWGDNTLGYTVADGGAKTSSLKPKLLTAFDGERVIGIASGAYHSLALTESGHVYSWGNNECGQLGIGRVGSITKPTQIIHIESKILKIRAGFDHNLLLSKEGYIYAFGCNECGELGMRTKTSDQYLPKKLKHWDKFVDIETDNSYSFSAALTESGNYYVWGLCGQEMHQLIPEPQLLDSYESFGELFLEKLKITQKPINNFNSNIKKRLSVQLSHDLTSITNN